MAVLTARVQRFFHLFILSTTSEKSFIPYKASAAVQSVKGLCSSRNFFFYHGFADLLRHIRIQSILRAHFGLIRGIHRLINARVRLAYRLVIV